MEVGFKSQMGINRTSNQDYFLSNAADSLFIVADGMGGHRAGNIASRLAVTSISSDFLSQVKAGKSNIKVLIQNAFKYSNEQIFRISSHTKSVRGMGTTSVLLYFKGSSAFLCSVGDSRAYLVRNKSIKRLTKDDSLVEELVRNREISKKEAIAYPYKNIITKAIGISQNVDVRASRLTVKKGDIFLLCSDGINKTLSDKHIYDILTSYRPVMSCDRLIHAAIEKGEKDDITAIVLFITKDME